jgi:hypothetical protein
MTWPWVVLLSVGMLLLFLGFALFLSYRTTVAKIKAEAGGDGTKPSGQPFGVR